MSEFQAERLIEVIDQHCKGKYPREFAHKFKRGFLRNERCIDSESIYLKSKFFDFKDCYCSVYSFSQWSDSAEERKRYVKIDTILFDIDHEDNLTLSLLEAKKLVKYLLSKDIVPRVYFSGAKGFHVFIDFPEIQLYDFKSLKDVASYFAKKLGISIDFNIYEPNRVSRLPYTVNTKTGYYCIPIHTDKFLELHLSDILHMAKDPKLYEIEVHENDVFLKYIRYFDMKKALEDLPPIEVSLKKKIRKLKPINVDSNKNWRQKRIELYTEVLKKHGYLSADPRIIAIHSRNKNVDLNNPGSIEHIARVHLVLLMIEEGYTDEQIHAVFRYAKDYDPRKTQYYIDYNRKWIGKKSF